MMDLNKNNRLEVLKALIKDWDEKAKNNPDNIHNLSTSERTDWQIEIQEMEGIIKDSDCEHDWNVHNDIGMDMVYCTKCESVKRDQTLALNIFMKMCEKIDINQ